MSNRNTQSFEDEHEAFAASRVSQYVYVPTKDSFFGTLDSHADTLEGDVKPPLVLLGNEGSGKSALMANWVSKRREHKHRDEFLFQHFVGCSTQSLPLLHTLFRLESALKNFFQLREMKVPDTEVELRWSLNRFLEAASKKHFPARIVIVIDGINRLKGENAAEGALHWLPTELPPCVRFILSTVEFERSSKGKKEGMPHRTFVELQRRQCPMLRIDPLGAHTRTSVISAFSSLYPDSFELTEAQQFRVMTAPSCAQPMYLRTLLQGLRLASSLTAAPIDKLLDKFLACSTAHDLIDKNLNICCQSTFSDGDDDSIQSDEGLLSDIMGKILSVVYMSRSGLTEAEIWGLIRMVSKFEPSEDQARKLTSILKDFTMVVGNMHSFSHEIYREVIYKKYINSKQSLTRWHNVLARFFDQLPPCDRKLVALPYHLEMAGSWNKVKNCLTDIDMFQLWWTPKFKSDFIKFWASLTRVTMPTSDEKEASQVVQKSKKDKKNSHKADNSDSDIYHASNGNASKPSFDIVEEYVKSLDEYRNIKHPSDEVVAGIILEIGDFLLEFATLGHEKDADVPALIHPKVLPEDLKSIGVPYVDIDEEGRSSLVYPEILHVYSNKYKTDDGPGTEGGKAIDDVPECTTYFFNRWMWIQFPYIALGNCDARYTHGVNQKLQVDMNDGNMRGKKLNDDGMDAGASGLRRVKSLVSGGSGEMSKSWSSKDMKLPKINFNRKAARSISRVNKDGDDELNAMNNKVQQRLMALQDSIANYREEFDFVVQMKSIVSKRLQDLKDALIDLQRTAESCSQYDGELEAATKREAEGAEKYDSVKTLHKNLIHLVTMAERHPANVPALITELQLKVDQDSYLLAEIKKRLWEQKFEHQTHSINQRLLKNLVAEAVNMHNKLLEHKYEYKRALTTQAQEEERNLNSSMDAKTKGAHESVHNKKNQSGRHGLPLGLNEKDNEPVVTRTEEVRSWEETWSIISSRTGIMEPESFFQRVENGAALIEQINTIKKMSESKLDLMKKEVVIVEAELEEARYQASFAGGQSSKEHTKTLAEKQHRLRHWKEKAESTEQLEQKVVAGLAHISEILFIPKGDDDTLVMNMVRDIEAVLDTLINEREKQLQQTQTQQVGVAGAGGSKDTVGHAANSVLPETLNRSPELDFVIAKHESPKVRLPSRLPSRPAATHSQLPTERSNGEDEEHEQEEGMWDRTFAKSVSLKSLKSELKKQAKLNKSSLGATF